MMTLLAQYPTIEEASIVQGMLKSYGIPAEIGDNAISSIFPAPDSGSGQISLYVDSENVSKASALLKAHGD